MAETIRGRRELKCLETRDAKNSRFHFSFSAPKFKIKLVTASRTARLKLEQITAYLIRSHTMFKKTLFILVVVVTFYRPSFGQEITLFSFPEPSVPSNAGTLIGRTTFTSAIFDQRVGVLFDTGNSDFFLSSISATLEYNSLGRNEATFDVYEADQNGLPSTLIESATVTDLPLSLFPAETPASRWDFTGNSLLQSGVSYLAIARAFVDPVGDESAGFGWRANTGVSPVPGVVAFNGVFQSGTTFRSPIVISGTAAVPEPSSGLLLAVGGGLAWQMRRRRQ